jgi:hypothetical protein
MDFDCIILTSDANSEALHLPRLLACLRQPKEFTNVLVVDAYIRAMPNHRFAIEPPVAAPVLALFNLPQVFRIHPQRERIDCSGVQSDEVLHAVFGVPKAAKGNTPRRISF